MVCTDIQWVFWRQIYFSFLLGFNIQNHYLDCKVSEFSVHVQYFLAKYLIVTGIALVQIISDQAGWTEKSEQFKATRTFLPILAATKDLKK